jgi:2-iminobutanoate/2-iminopropanoate deaminase
MVQVMVRAHSSPDAPPEEQAYSHGVEANGFLFTAGQVPMTPSGDLVEGSVTAKTHQIMENLDAILGEADLAFEDVVKTTAYFTDIEDFEEMDDAYAEYFDGEYPARDVIEVEALPAGATVELVMVGSLGQ